MIYSVQKAQLIAKQIHKFSTADSWIVAEQFSNFDFWFDEIKSALITIDEHNLRFQKMCDSRKNYIETHNILVPNNCPICQGICEFGNEFKTPRIPKKSGAINKQKQEAKTDIIESTYAYLLRCFKLNLITEKEFKNLCEEIGTSVDFNDLENQ